MPNTSETVASVPQVAAGVRGRREEEEEEEKEEEGGASNFNYHLGQPESGWLGLVVEVSWGPVSYQSTTV